MIQGDATRTILLVEDDPAIAAMYQMGLNAMGGYRVVLVRSGDAALEQLSGSAPPSLVVLDLGLPGVDGLDVLEVARARPATAHVPVIILSNRDNDFEEAYRRGASVCLAKHRTTPLQLLTRIEASIRSAA